WSRISSSSPVRLSNAISLTGLQGPCPFPCFLTVVLSSRRLPSLLRVPVSLVPRSHRYYEGATTSHLRVGGRLFCSLPPPTRSSCFVFAVALREGWRPRPGLWVPAARSSGYFTWTPVGSLRSPGDPFCAFAPLLDPGRTDVPLPWRSHRCCPRLLSQRRLRTMRISGLAHAASAPALLRFAFRVAIHAQGRLLAGWPLPGGCQTLWITTKGLKSHGHPPFLSS